MPNTARVYSHLLGGKDNFPSDRAEADLLLKLYPPLAEMVQENRAFIAEAVTWTASQGVGQFIDLGAGLPATPAVHQTAQAILPAARVAYVDLDPMVLSHARALLAGPGVAAVAADLRDPAAVLADQDLRTVINPAEPVCVVLGAVLHFLDADAAREVTAGYARLIAPGSYVVISCAAYDDEALAKKLATEYTAGQFVNHTREDVTSFFAGLHLVGPGVTEAQTWRAWMPQPVLRRREGHVLVGVARRQALPPACQPARRRCQRYPGRAGQSPGPRSVTQCGMHWPVMAAMRRILPGSQRS
jgi:O-methyltransferase involved in polyketide biosynthesis